MCDPPLSGPSRPYHTFSTRTECDHRPERLGQEHYPPCNPPVRQLHGRAGRANPQSESYRPQSLLDSILSKRALFSSHGEFMRDVMGSLSLASGDTLVLDEPGAGQDVRWIQKLREVLENSCRSLGIQIIMASHHPAFWLNCHLIELAPGYAQETRRLYRGYLSALLSCKTTRGRLSAADPARPYRTAIGRSRQRRARRPRAPEPESW